MTDLPQDTSEEGGDPDVQFLDEVINKPPAKVLVLPQEMQNQVLEALIMSSNFVGTSETTGGSADVPRSERGSERNAVAEPYNNSGAVDPDTLRMYQQQQALNLVEQVTGDMQVRVEDAMKYLDLIKVRYNYRPDVYDSFLEIMKDFKSHNIKVPCVIKRVVDLFRDHEDLIFGFNVFLPPISKITWEHLKGKNETSPTTSADTSRQYNSPSTYFMDSERKSSIPGNSLQGVSGGAVPNRPPWLGPRILPTNLSSFPPYGRRFSLLANHPAVLPYLVPPAPPRVPTRQSHPTTPSHEYAQYQGSARYAMEANEYANKQPQEYNQALFFVNKIKTRLESDKYKEFLEILHEYQRVQRRSAGSPNPVRKLSEHDIYCKVSKLFENHSDLLDEFMRYLQTSSDEGQSSCSSEQVGVNSERQVFTDAVVGDQETSPFVPVPYPSVSSMPKQLEVETSKDTTQKRVPCSPAKVSKKRAKLLERLSRTSVSVEEYDKWVEELYSMSTYEDTVRFILLFNAGLIGNAELTSPLRMLLGESSEFLKQMNRFTGPDPSSCIRLENSSENLERVAEKTRAVLSAKIKEVFDILELDPSICRRIGHSYGRIPLEKYSLPKCSGRTTLCNEVLNDEWFSYPGWTEPTGLCISKKMSYEEIMYKCEEERFELDFVIQTNSDLIKILEQVTRQMDGMTLEQRYDFTLDDCLGGQSTIHKRVIKRIYGEGRGEHVIVALKKSPITVVPCVLKRLKAKNTEWRKVQVKCNLEWEEQVKRYYLRSLDHMGSAFKQSDTKAIRPKALLTEIENVHKEMLELDDGHDSIADMSLVYKDLSVFTDAYKLLLHCVRRLLGIRSEDKRKVKEILRQFLPNLFLLPEMEMSDDEGESSKGSDQKSPVEIFGETCAYSQEEIYNENDAKQCGIDAQVACLRFINFEKTQTDSGRVFFASHRWYVFLRLHHILCDRLASLKIIATKRFEEFKRESSQMKNSAAFLLRKLPMQNLDDVAGYYPMFLESVMDVLDGHLESVEYEDQIRNFFGVNAYFAFTIEKIVSNAISQLQFFASETASRKCVELFKESSLFDVRSVTEPNERLQALYKAYSSKALAELGKDLCVRVVIDASDSSRQMAMKWVGENSERKETANR